MLVSPLIQPLKCILDPLALEMGPSLHREGASNASILLVALGLGDGGQELTVREGEHSDRKRGQQEVAKGVGDLRSSDRYLYPF